jgi:hypothetical protein
MKGKMLPRNLTPVGDEFFSTAGMVMKGSVDIPHSAEQIWDAITGDQIGTTASSIAQATWRSSSPRTTGAVRSIRILRILQIEEEFYRLEAPFRATFRVTSISVPLVSGWAEDLQLERREGGGTRVSLTMALDNKLLRVIGIPGWLQPKLNAGCKRMISGIVNYLPPPDGR